MKDESSAFSISLLRLQEMQRLLAPMAARIEMVSCVVAIIEAEAIAGYIDESYARTEVRVWFEFVYEGVLAPVADHETEAEKDEWYDEGKDAGSSVDFGCHEVHECHACHF